MNHQGVTRVQSSSASTLGRSHWAALLLASALIGGFIAQAQEATPPAAGNGRISAPAGTFVHYTAPLQPSSSVEATALAIAYHATAQAGASPTAEAVGKYAAQMMNAFAEARK